MLAHGVGEGDAGFLANAQGFHFWPYFYLGAKHMVTGYDHLLYLAGVLFFLTRAKDVILYASLFALGHSITLLAGVYFNIPANAYLVDAIIGMSVVYKAFENLGGFAALGLAIDPRAAVAGFGLIHGLGLATKLQAISLSDEGLLGNLVAFNLGVEAGQLLALSALVTLLFTWRRLAPESMDPQQPTTVAINVGLMVCGFMLCFYQLAGYLWLA